MVTSTRGTEKKTLQLFKCIYLGIKPTGMIKNETIAKDAKNLISNLCHRIV